MYNKCTDDIPDDSSHLPANILSHRTAYIISIRLSQFPTLRTAYNTAFCLSYVTTIDSPLVAPKLPAFFPAQCTTIPATIVMAIITTYDISHFPPNDDAINATFSPPQRPAIFESISSSHLTSIMSTE